MSPVFRTEYREVLVRYALQVDLRWRRAYGPDFVCCTPDARRPIFQLRAGVDFFVTGIDGTGTLLRTIYSSSVEGAARHEQERKPVKCEASDNTVAGKATWISGLLLPTILLTPPNPRSHASDPMYVRYPCAATMKVSFSLNKAKTTSTGVAPSLKQPAAFASLADDEPIDAAPTASSSKPSLASNRALAAQAAAPRIPKAQQKRIDAEKQVDASVYDYDEVWERMQDAKARLKELKEKESKERQVSNHAFLFLKNKH